MSKDHSAIFGILNNIDQPGRIGCKLRSIWGGFYGRNLQVWLLLQRSNLLPSLVNCACGSSAELTPV